MLSEDIKVLQFTRDCAAAGLSPWLCTIVQTAGSSPRPVGSMLCCLADGRQQGSLSGGCVEEDLLAGLRAGDIGGSQPQVLEYGVSAEENERLGLPCGGRLQLLVQQLSDADVDWLDQVVEAVEQRHCLARELDLQTGDLKLSPREHYEPLQFNGQQLRQTFGPRMRLLLVGAGQLASSLADLALGMDYEVLLTDPRQDALDRWDGPELPKLQGMPDDIVREHGNDRHAIVITLTHDPRIDDMALMEALESEAWYVGALGSVRTTEKRLARLAQLGLEKESLDRLRAPVGLPIGSKTPLEIAVAIMAELTQLRRQKP